MTRQWKLTLSYDGSRFHGWQVQPGLETVQGCLARAIHDVFAEDVLPQGSGRTDAGVHALAQVASFPLRAAIPSTNLLRALNRVLPASIRIDAAEVMPDGFHARHSARWKIYEYRIFERRRFLSPGLPVPERICSPFIAPYAWDCRWPLHLDLMQEAATLLCGTHDFTSFAASDPELNNREGAKVEDGHCGTNRVKTISASAWRRESDFLVYRVRGSGFLHHMVRNIVGTLVEVGRGSLSPADIPNILAARSRTAAGPTAPARGLFLKEVVYEQSPENA